MGEFDSIVEKLDFREILYDVSDGVATVTLNRPKAYNSYSTRTLKELALAFQNASWDDSVSVIVYTGSGDRAFCTGGDVKEYATVYTRRPRDYWKYMGLFRSYLESIMHSGKPVIARLNGMAVGGGNESQLACDLAVMGDHTYIGQVGTSVGSVACGGATQWLPLVVGDRRAREMLMLNPKISAAKAKEWGLVNEAIATVTKDGDFIEGPTPDQIRHAHKKENGFAIDLRKLDAKVAEYVSILKDKFPECMRYTKANINQNKEFVWQQTIEHAADWLSIHFATPEPAEGMRAFVEKRKPDVAGLRKRWAEGDSPEFFWGAPEVDCAICGAKGLPNGFDFCGACGHAVKANT